MNMIEENGTWPTALTQGLVSLISKGGGVRPIGLMSCVYRLWVAARVGDDLSWQELWVDESMHGFGAAIVPRTAGGPKPLLLSLHSCRVLACLVCLSVIANVSTKFPSTLF